MTDKRANMRPEKKSETLEVRLPHSKKEAFKAACEDEGITASHAVRTFIDAYLKRSRRVKLKRIAEDITMKLFRNPLKTTGAIGATLTAAILFTASPSVAEDNGFKLLDENKDGYLTSSDSTLVANFLLSDAAAKHVEDNRLSPSEWASLNARLMQIADTEDPSIAPKGPPIKFIFILQGPNTDLSEAPVSGNYYTWSSDGTISGQSATIETLDNGDSDPETFDMRI